MTIIIVLLIYTSILNTYLFCVYLYEKYFYRWEIDWYRSPFSKPGDQWNLQLIIFDKDLHCGHIYDLKLKRKIKENES